MAEESSVYCFQFSVPSKRLKTENSSLKTDFQERLAIRAHKLPLGRALTRDHRNIQALASCTCHCRSKAVPLLGFKREIGSANPEIPGLKLKAAKAISADVIEAAFRLAAIDQIC